MFPWENMFGGALIWDSKSMVSSSSSHSIFSETENEDFLNSRSLALVISLWTRRGKEKRTKAL